MWWWSCLEAVSTKQSLCNSLLAEMSKRSSKSGDSPTPKSQKFAGSSSSESSSKQLNCSLSFLDDHSGGGSSQPPDQIDFRFDTGSSPTSSNYGFPVNPDSDTLSHQSEASSFFHESQPKSQPPSQIRLLRGGDSTIVKTLLLCPFPISFSSSCLHPKFS